MSTLGYYYKVMEVYSPLYLKRGIHIRLTLRGHQYILTFKRYKVYKMK